MNMAFTPRKLAGILVPPVVVLAVIAVVLHLLNAVPPMLQSPAVQQLASIEEAQKETGVKAVLPAYFPEYFAWPASGVQVTERPFLSLKLTFTAAASGAESLWIYQTLAGQSGTGSLAPPPRHITQSKSLPLKDVQATLLIGATADGVPVYQLSWISKNNRYAVVTTYSLDELIRIAGSMIR